MTRNKLLLLLALLMTAATGAWAQSVTTLADATTADVGKVVCAAGHLHDAKTAVPAGCTAVGILGKVTEKGQGLILALQDSWQTWNTINGWTSVDTYAGTTLKQLPSNALGSNLTSYTALGETAVSDWCVAQKSEYEAIFQNLGSEKFDSDGYTYDGNVNAFITTGVGGSALSDTYWSNSEFYGLGWAFTNMYWTQYDKSEGYSIRPVLGFNAPAAPTTYSLTMKSGVKDADKWTVKVGEGQAQALPVGGLSEGDAVTLQYNGRLKVKGVKATSDAAAAKTGKALSEATAEDVGKVAGQDGYIYDNVEAATAAGTTASAIIAYVGTAGSVDESSSTYKGLAIALTDANSGSTCQWYTDISGTCVSQTNDIATAITYKNGIASTNTLTSDDHTHAAATAASSYGTDRPSGVSAWILPSMGQWNLIVQGLATKQAGSTVSTDLTTSGNSTYKATNLNTVITAAGGTGLQSGRYQSSTEYDTLRAWNMAFNGGGAASGFKTNVYYVRAVFAF